MSVSGNYRSGSGVASSPNTPIWASPWTRTVDVRSSVTSPVLLGSVETRPPAGETTYSKTDLLQPLLRFSFPGAKPGSITLRDVDTPANTFGPFALNAQDEAQVNVNLTIGKTYEIVETADNSEGDAVQIVGTIEVVALVWKFEDDVNIQWEDGTGIALEA